jgi:hypothetical protein
VMIEKYPKCGVLVPSPYLGPLRFHTAAER